MTADTVGGVWNYSLSLCSQLSLGGSAIALATFGPRPSEHQRREANSIGNLILLEGDHKLEWTPNATKRDIFEGAQWLASIERWFKPDVIHLNSYAHAAWPWRCPVLVVAHSCVLSWWVAVHGTIPPQNWDGYRARVAAGLRVADAVVAPTEWMLAQLEPLYAVSLRSSQVIYNFTSDMAAFDSKQPIICSGGRIWDPAKNFQLLDRAARKINWPLFAFGEETGPEGSTFHPLHMRTTGLQPRDTIARLLSVTSIFVHPARYEPFGLCVLEAATQGCALILSDIPTLRELWDGAALFASPDDEDAWVQLANRLIEKPDVRAEYSRLSAQRAQRFSRITSIGHYQRAYTQLISGSERSAELQRMNA